MSKRVDYDDRLHAVYAHGRALSDVSIGRWLDAFEAYLPAPRPLTLVDIGSGTGRFTPHLAERFGGPVVGVEPFAEMRQRAVADAAHPLVEYRDGRAESLPLDASSCDGALLYFVWHHVEDRARAAAEIRRVVRDGGTLLLRTQLADAMPELWWYAYSEAARHVDRAMFIPLDTLRSEIEAHGWSFLGMDEVSYEVATSQAAYADRLRLRALSTFEHMSDADVDALFAAIARADLDDREPVVEVGNLLAWTAE